jgi:hypothetical protein
MPASVLARLCAVGMPCRDLSAGPVPPARRRDRTPARAIGDSNALFPRPRDGNARLNPQPKVDILERTLAFAVLSARVAYGAGLMAAPERITGAWLGPASTRPVQVPVRGLGASYTPPHSPGGRCGRGWPRASPAT